MFVLLIVPTILFFFYFKSFAKFNYVRILSFVTILLFPKKGSIRLMATQFRSLLAGARDLLTHRFQDKELLSKRSLFLCLLPTNI